MKGQIKGARTPAQYLAALEGDRKRDVTALHKLIRKVAPGLEPHIRSGMLGYGPYHYKYPSGREGEWFRIGLASNKAYISLYCCAADKDGYVAERFKKALPKASIGKSCVRFKRLSDLDPVALEKLIKATAKTGFSM